MNRYIYNGFKIELLLKYLRSCVGKLKTSKFKTDTKNEDYYLDYYISKFEYLKLMCMKC